MTTHTVRFVDSAAELTAEWVTAALRRAGHDAQVRAVRHERIGTGQMGASYRLHLEYAESDSTDVPASLVAKFGAGAPPARERVKQGFEKEVRFYQHLAPLTSVRVPRCWFADISADLLTFTLLLDDLAPDVPGRQVDGCSVEQALAGVANLAGLHAPLWGSPVLDEHADWLTPTDPAAGEFLGTLMVDATEQFITRYRDRLSGQDQETLAAVAAETGRWASAGSDIVTAIHGDYRLDNLMFAPDGVTVTALDWQTTTTGAPSRDVAYFVSTSLLIDERRGCERQLLERYHDALFEAGIDYSFEQLFDDYRRDMLHGPLITVLGCVYATAQPSPESDEMFLSMLTRSCAAIRELASLDAVTT